MTKVIINLSFVYFLILHSPGVQANSPDCALPLPDELTLRKQIGQMFIVTIRGLRFKNEIPPSESLEATNGNTLKDKSTERDHKKTQFIFENRFTEEELDAVTKYYVGGIIVREEENLYRRKAIYKKNYNKAKSLFPPVDYILEDSIPLDQWISNLRRLNELSISHSGIPLLVSADAEPGAYIVFSQRSQLPIATRLQQDIPELGEVWTARRLATFQENTSWTFKYGQYIAKELVARGVHMNLAPNVSLPRTYFGQDTSRESLGTTIFHPQGGRIISWAADFRERDFGKDPFIRTYHANSFMQATKEAGLIPTLKHFPGNYSEEGINSRYKEPQCPHYALSKIFPDHFNRRFYESFFPFFEDPFEKMLVDDLYPFINARYKDAVMVAHSFVPNLASNLGGDPTVPILFSKEIVTDFIKNELGYKIVITDEMAILERFCVKDSKKWAQNGHTKIMGRHCRLHKTNCVPIDHRDAYWTQFSSLGDIVVEAVKAGVDLFIVANHARYPQENTWESVESVFQAVERGDIPYCRVKDAYDRVQAMKKEAGLT